MSFTARVREELAHAPSGRRCCHTVETLAMVRLAGALHLTDAGPAWVVDVGDGAVARRLRAGLTELFDIRPDVEVHRRTGLHGQRYRLPVRAPARTQLQRLGVLDSRGRPVETLDPAAMQEPHDAAAFVRGAIMASGSISDPRRPPHLEIRAPNGATAEVVRSLLMRCGAPGARSAVRDDGWRVVTKSGEAIGAVLAHAGAHAAFLTWDGERLRRELRGEANRATNADQANLVRAAGAAARQVAAIEKAVRQLGWEHIPDDLRTTALVRLANPQAPLGDLGALHDPPVGKATVHRRLARLAELAEGDAFEADR
ncbi:MAG: DNA-binding protein WhiA [Nitriliruptorales bacterium]|nr:DNA-binding protein WhiA [Nitriliruptorales bacterium]